MTREKIRSGIIGAGFIGGVHAYAVRAAGGRLTRIADATLESGRKAAGRLGAEEASASPEELIASDDVDIVHICTPNVTHAALAQQAIAHGKAVICEKPLATTVPDAERLTELAREAGVLTAVPFVYRFHPHVRETRARIAAGDAGRLWMLHGSYLQDWLSRSDDTNWRVDPAVGGVSRAFGDIGVHWCDLMEFVTGQRIVRLSARTAQAFDNRSGTEDGAVVMFETDGGASGSLVVSQVSPGRKNRLWFSFDGTDASFSFDQESPEWLWVGRREESCILPRNPLTEHPGAGRLSRLPAGHPQGYQDAFSAFVADVHEAFRGGTPDGLPTFDDGLRAARITEAVVASSAESTWKELIP
ncbi:gfo/Idh/MocA family oxidoreductase [Arachnia propionica]|uniref:Gfo/Idh/MocA family oxidoreductase n=1 Tax=Arachnia propionica TaxID=1750 RepID=A0A3P1T472_9ACTN|nr:Gfo/Idh/MocA family oxidoreductase [Arachnia propionica]RRD04317.1 gfo/Idh/MocA family oxidoreductase [Arachnia propionica]